MNKFSVIFVSLFLLTSCGGSSVKCQVKNGASKQISITYVRSLDTNTVNINPNNTVIIYSASGHPITIEEAALFSVSEFDTLYAKKDSLVSIKNYKDEHEWYVYEKGIRNYTCELVIYDTDFQ